MAFMEETPDSLRVWFGLGGALNLIGGMLGLLGLSRMGVTLIPLVLFLAMVLLGGGLGYLAIHLPRLLKSGSKLPLQLIQGLVLVRVCTTVIGIIRGAPYGPL